MKGWAWSDTKRTYEIDARRRLSWRRRKAAPEGRACHRHCHQPGGPGLSHGRLPPPASPANGEQTPHKIHRILRDGKGPPAQLVGGDHSMAEVGGQSLGCRAARWQRAAKGRVQQRASGQVPRRRRVRELARAQVSQSSQGPGPGSGHAPGKLSGWKGSCVTLGRMRYSQDRRFCARGAVKAVPLSCSAYRPYGQTRGLFCPCGSAFGRASDCASLPAGGSGGGADVTVQHRCSTTNIWMAASKAQSGSWQQGATVETRGALPPRRSRTRGPARAGLNGGAAASSSSRTKSREIAQLLGLAGSPRWRDGDHAAGPSAVVAHKVSDEHFKILICDRITMIAL